MTLFLMLILGTEVGVTIVVVVVVVGRGVVVVVVVGGGVVGAGVLKT
jgi:hypothetical protein